MATASTVATAGRPSTHRKRSAYVTNRLSRPIIRLSAVFASAAVGLMLLGVIAAPANASTPSRENIAVEKAVMAKVFNAPDREAAYTALTASDKAVMAQALTHQQATTVISLTSPVSATAVASDTMVAAAGGCWSHYQYDAWSDLGYTEGYTWEQLNWCSNGSSITSYSRPGNLTGGQGQNGVAYQGVVAGPYVNVGWEIRAAVEFKFVVLNTGVILQPCMQIRGGATGLYSTLRTCNLS